MTTFLNVQSQLNTGMDSMADLRHAKSSFNMEQLGFRSWTEQERVATKRERPFSSCSCVPWIIMRLSPCHIVILNIQLLTASTIVVRGNSCKLFNEGISPVVMAFNILQQHCMPKQGSKYWDLTDALFSKVPGKNWWTSSLCFFDLPPQGNRTLKTIYHF